MFCFVLSRFSEIASLTVPAISNIFCEYYFQLTLLLLFYSLLLFHIMFDFVLYIFMLLNVTERNETEIRNGSVLLLLMYLSCLLFPILLLIYLVLKFQSISRYCLLFTHLRHSSAAPEITRTLKSRCRC